MKISSVGSNMTELQTDGATVLISYNTPVAAWIEGKFFRTEKRWSPTTSRHITKWLSGESAEERPQEYFDVLV